MTLGAIEFQPQSRAAICVEFRQKDCFFKPITVHILLDKFQLGFGQLIRAQLHPGQRCPGLQRKNRFLGIKGTERLRHFQFCQEAGDF